MTQRSLDALDLSTGTIPAYPAIGSVLWRVVNSPHEVTRPCPICNGRLAIMVELGDGTRVSCECDACGTGFDRPQGLVTEWVQEAKVAQFVITAVKAYREDDGWTLADENGYTEYAKHLYVDAVEAQHEAEVRCAAFVKHNMQAQLSKRKADRVKGYGWTVRYHLDCIKDMERKIAWHRGQISTQKPVPNGKENL